MSKCYAKDLVAKALSQVDYHEKASNSNLDSFNGNNGSGNWTKYGRDIDTKYPNFYNGKKNGYDWCDQLADWCFLDTFGYENALRLLCQPEHSLGAGCGYSARYYQNADRFSKTPKIGSQIFFQNSMGICHTGIVVDVDASRVYTVEGNSNNRVEKKSYWLTDSRIYGYGHPAYDVEDKNDTKPVKKKKKLDVIAKEVIDGKWGVGTERKKKLTDAGYDYDKVQTRVNELLSNPKPVTQYARVTPKVGLNIRKKPSVDAEKITALVYDTKVEVIEKSSADWWKIKYNNITGYCACAYLKLI